MASCSEEKKPDVTLHASCVALDGHGALILGASGTGKSTLALQLMGFGALLVSDDRTYIRRQGLGLYASSPDPIAGLIEARGLGILSANHLPEALIDVVVDMDTVETERLPHPHHYTLEGLDLPCLHKVDSIGFPAAVLQYLKGGKRESQ